MCHASQTQQLSRQSGNGSLSRQSFGALATCQVPMSFWHVGSARGTKNRHVGIAPILRSRCFAQLDNMLLNSPLVKPNPPPPCEINQENFQDMLGHLDLPGWEECSKKCWPCLERPRAPAKEDAERQGDQKKIVTPSCQVLCRSLAMYVLPVMDVLQIHDWTHDWICKFMTGALILINKPRGGWCWSTRNMCEPRLCCHA